jgi:hypothetical protein
MYRRLRDDIKKSVIMGGFRHTVESPRYHYPEAELWLQSTSARAWQWNLYDWSRWFDIHEVDPTSYYPGIRLQRPDVLAWYYLQGSERPIYMISKVREIIGSRKYPINTIMAEFGEEGTQHLGCQADYMGALALHEKFERWILYGMGQPYTEDREGPKAASWFKRHGTFLYWLRLAKSRGVDIVLDTPETNMFNYEMIDNEEKWPTPGPLKARYGYDMSVDSEYWLKWKDEINDEHPFAADYDILDPNTDTKP